MTRSQTKQCPGCGVPISGSKETCQACGEVREEIREKVNRGVPAGVTHVILRHESIGLEELYRADGMFVGGRKNDKIHFGEDIATSQSRFFLNNDLASQYVLTLAHIDLVAQKQGKPLIELVRAYGPHGTIALDEEVKIHYIDVEKSYGTSDGRHLILPAAVSNFKLN